VSQRGLKLRASLLLTCLFILINSPRGSQAGGLSGAHHVPRCAYFYSRDTGLVQLTEFGTNEPVATDPIEPIARVHLSLADATSEIRFVSLANHKRAIESAVISEARAPASFLLRNARVIGYSPIRNERAHDDPQVELEITSWSLLKPDALRFPTHRIQDCST
jgi:hypothetical protein